MRKIFARYFLIIAVITIGATLIANFSLQTIFAQQKAETQATDIVAEIEERIDRNEQVIADLTVSLNENYITRAKAFAEMIAQKPEIIESFEEMERIAKLLHVGEVHVTDENGILRFGNVKAYYGLDFEATDQTRPFLPALTDKGFALAQEPQPNGSEGKLFQYISVARQDKSGIVQVGVAPDILDNALSNNKIENVIANYNVGEGMNVVVYDAQTGMVAANSKNDLIGRNYAEMGIVEDFLNGSKQSGWIGSGREKLFAVFSNSDRYVFEVTFTQEKLFAERQNQNFVAAASSILLGLVIVVTIFLLLKRVIIDSMEAVNRDVKKITDGSLDVQVHADSTPEFSVLSNGINEMVCSLKRQMDEIGEQAAKLQRQAAELEESNLNILASLSYARKIQNNLLPSSKAFDETFSDYQILWEPRDTVGGDIYWMKGFDDGAVLCVCDCTGHGTPGALLTMIVVTALDAIVEEKNHNNTARILWELEQRLVSTLNVTETEKGVEIHDGADLSILYIAKDGSIKLSSAKLHLFICDGKTVENIRGQKLSIGDGSLKSEEQIKTVSIEPSTENSYYIVSDGLFEQVGGKERIPFGYSRFKQLILEHHGEPEAHVTNCIWKEFQSYMGEENRRDDVTLVSFRL